MAAREIKARIVAGGGNLTFHSPMWALALVTMILAAGCAPAIVARDGSSPGGHPSSSAPAVKATDPVPGADICTGYSFDGVVLGMPRSELEKITPLIEVPHSSSLIPGFEKSTFALKAVRLGRADDIQVGFNPGRGDAGPTIGAFRARIFVSKTDSWPLSLFTFLGSPKRARVGEWVWWHTECRATLRLSRVSSLGRGDAQPYLLDVRQTPGPPSP